MINLTLQHSNKTRKGILVFCITLIIFLLIEFFQTTDEWIRDGTTTWWIATFLYSMHILYFSYGVLDIYIREITISKDRRFIKFIKPFKTKIIGVSDIKE